MTPKLSYHDGCVRDAREVRDLANHMAFDLPDGMDINKHPTAQCMAFAIMEIIRLRKLVVGATPSSPNH